MSSKKMILREVAVRRTGKRGREKDKGEGLKVHKNKHSSLRQLRALGQE